MSNDRSNWQLVRFGDVVANVNKTRNRSPEERFDRVVGLEHMDGGALHIARWDKDGSLASFNKIFRKGQTLFAKRRAYQRKIAVADFEGICSGDILVFDTQNPNILIQDLIPFICMSDNFYKYVESNSQGSLSPRVSFFALSRYEFLLPPIDEQKRIVEVLWAGDKACCMNVELRKSLNEIKSLLLNEMNKYVLSGSKTVLLGEVIGYASGQVDPRQEPYASMPLVAPNHIESGTGRITEIITAVDQHAISGKYCFQTGDVVYSKIRPALNKVFIAEFEGLCSADMYPLRANPEKIIPAFLYYLLSSDAFVKFATVASVRTSIPKINRTDMSKFGFYLPPLQYQRDLCRKLKALDDAIHKANDVIRSCESLVIGLTGQIIGGANNV